MGPVSLTESGIYELLQIIVKPLECRRPVYVNYLIFSVLFVIRKILLAKSLSGANNFCLVSHILSGFECERLRIGTFSSLTRSSETFIFVRSKYSYVLKVCYIRKYVVSKRVLPNYRYKYLTTGTNNQNVGTSGSFTRMY